MTNIQEIENAEGLYDIRKVKIYEEYKILDTAIARLRNGKPINIKLIGDKEWTKKKW